MLEEELGSWPGVTAKPMFGMVGLYREAVIFAALPRTCALYTPNSIIFKFDPMPPVLFERAKQDALVSWEKEGRQPRWYSFELNSAQLIDQALWWLGQAYERAEGKAK